MTLTDTLITGINTIDPSIIDLINSQSTNTLELVSRNAIPTISNLPGNNTTMNVANGLLNSNPSCKYYLELHIMLITPDNALNIVHINSPHEFLYQRFIESIERNIDRIANSNIPTSVPKGHLFIPNINHLDKGNFTYMAYYGFQCFKAHISWFMALIFMLVRIISSNRFSLFLFLLILQARPVAAANIKLANKIIAGLVWFAYICMMGLYDILYKNIKRKLVEDTLIVNRKINWSYFGKKQLLGFLFLIVINLGVLFSTSFAYIFIEYMSITIKIALLFLSFIIAALASTVWILLTIPEITDYNWHSIILSLLRALAESFAFNALSFANFIIWDLLPQIPVVFITTFAVGSIIYIPTSYFLQIPMEIQLHQSDYIYYYGIIYDCIFTMLSMSSSGLYYWMGIPSMTTFWRIFIMIVCIVLINLFPLEVYRFSRRAVRLGDTSPLRTILEYLLGRGLPNDPRFIRIIAVLYQWVVFFAFAIATYIWLDFTPLYR